MTDETTVRPAVEGVAWYDGRGSIWSMEQSHKLAPADGEWTALIVAGTRDQIAARVRAAVAEVCVSYEHNILNTEGACGACDLTTARVLAALGIILETTR